MHGATIKMTVHVCPTVMKATSIEQRFPDFFARGPLLVRKTTTGPPILAHINMEGPDQNEQFISQN
jgi:hypothetical protein